MDRETVRLALLIGGGVLILAVYLWGRYRDRILDFVNRRGEFDELEYEEDGAEPSELEPGKADALAPDGRLNPRTVKVSEEAPPIYLEDEEEEYARPIPPKLQPPVNGASRTAPLGAPFLIQLSVVASADGFFNGEELHEAMLELDLIYGDMNIYHRYDREYREPLFSVASLVEPGSFPIDHMENFHCPGIVLFFQPPQVDNPLAVFDDLINTAHELAVRLDGVEWDERRQPLSQEKILQMRQRLEEAY
jgi:cell division protein ZipA